MQGYFSFYKLPFKFLFEPWVVNTAVTLLFTCLAIGSVALLFEGIRVLRVWVKKHFEAFPLVPILSCDLTPTGSESPIINSIRVTASESHVRTSRIKNHLWQTFIHVMRLLLSYLLMLAIMTYNAYVCISIIGGACLGYFIFCHELTRWRLPDTCSNSGTAVNTVSALPTTPNDEAHPMLKECSQKLNSANDNFSDIKA